MSYPLHQNTLRCTSQLSEACVTLLTFSAAKFHLDEFVVLQGVFDLGDQGIGEALAPHLEDGAEVVGLAPEEARLRTGQ